MACGSCGGRKTAAVRRGTRGVTASAAPGYEVVYPDGRTEQAATLVEARRLARASHPRAAIKVK